MLSRCTNIHFLPAGTVRALLRALCGHCAGTVRALWSARANVLFVTFAPHVCLEGHAMSNRLLQLLERVPQRLQKPRPRILDWLAESMMDLRALKRRAVTFAIDRNPICLPRASHSSLQVTLWKFGFQILGAAASPSQLQHKPHFPFHLPCGWTELFC